MGLDGVNYHFYAAPNLYGHVWGGEPENLSGLSGLTSNMFMLAQHLESLIDADKAKTQEILKSANLIAQELQNFTYLHKYRELLNKSEKTHQSSLMKFAKNDCNKSKLKFISTLLVSCKKELHDLDKENSGSNLKMNLKKGCLEVQEIANLHRTHSGKTCLQN